MADDMNSLRIEVLAELLPQVLAELRRISHPAFEAKLLDEIRRHLVRQEATTQDLKTNLEQLHHDLMWIRKHMSALQLHLSRLGVVHEAHKED